MSAEPSRTIKEPSIQFEDFWSVWPNKNGKADAKAAFSKLKPDERQEAQRLAGAWWKAWRKEYPDARPILPATYLRKRRWEDEFAAGPVVATEEQVWARRADAVRSGLEWQTRHITASQVRELLNRNLVTIEECRKAGVA